jgi:quinol monooxygenase YgiN
MKRGTDIHRYKDAAALKAHGAFPEFKDTMKVLGKEQLLAGKTQILVLGAAAGFSRL